MTFAGEKLTRANLPADAEQQARRLVGALQRHGIRHNDIHRDNLLVLNGQVQLIDFAWACGTDDPLDFLPKSIGVAYGVRAEDDPIDDLTMLLRSIELMRGGQQA
jgi:hypothetical protein